MRGKKKTREFSKRAEESNYWGPLWVNCVPTLLTLILSNKHHFYPPSLFLQSISQRESVLTSNKDRETRSSYVRLKAVCRRWPRWPKGKSEVYLETLFYHHWTLPASSGTSIHIIPAIRRQSSSSWRGGQIPSAASLGSKPCRVIENIRPVMVLVEEHVCKLQDQEFSSVTPFHWWSWSKNTGGARRNSWLSSSSTGM